jgi:lactoylglutathione lyase
MIVPVYGLLEAQLAPCSLDRSIAFYHDVLCPPLAPVIAERNVAFFRVPTSETAMLSLWSIGASPLSMRLHVAFDVTLQHVRDPVGDLRAAGLTLHPPDHAAIDEPVVLAWMTAASVYFDDPDGHSLEFIAMLPDRPRPEPGCVAWSEWRRVA